MGLGVCPGNRADASDFILPIMICYSHDEVTPDDDQQHLERVGTAKRPKIKLTEERLAEAKRLARRITDALGQRRG